jgi:hypothetical protein
VAPGTRCGSPQKQPLAAKQPKAPLTIRPNKPKPDDTGLQLQTISQPRESIPHTPKPFRADIRKEKSALVQAVQCGLVDQL